MQRLSLEAKQSFDKDSRDKVVSEKRHRYMGENDHDKDTIVQFVRKLKNSSLPEKVTRLRIMLEAGDFANLGASDIEEENIEIRKILKNTFSSLLHDSSHYATTVELLSEMFPYPPTAISRAGILTKSNCKLAATADQSVQSLVEVTDILNGVRHAYGHLSKSLDLVYVFLVNSMKVQMQAEDIYDVLLGLDLSVVHGYEVVAEKLINLVVEIVSRYKARLDGNLVMT